jgi:hypothetical protein
MSGVEFWMLDDGADFEVIRLVEERIGGVLGGGWVELGFGVVQVQ